MRFLPGSRGMALVIVLGILVIGMGLMAGLLKMSSQMQQTSLQNSARAQAEINADEFSERLKNEILSIVQTAMASPTLYATQCPGDPGLSATCIRNIRGTRLSTQEMSSVLYLRCLGEGQSPNGVCTRSDVLPKIYDFAIQREDPSTGTIMAAQMEFQIQRAGLNAYAFFIKAETKPSVLIGPSLFEGIFGINFADPTRTSPAHRVLFRPGQSSITFENMFLTNIPPSRFDFDNQASVTFERGVLQTSASTSFSQINDLVPSLINQAVNFDDLKTNHFAYCSKITFDHNSSITYREYKDFECKDEGLVLTKTYAPGNAASLYARGKRILLESADEKFLMGVNNIAIVADGNFELRTPLIRHPDLTPLVGYPILLTPQNLIIPKDMRTLLTPPVSLSEIKANDVPAPSTPVIQVDLSYVSTGTGSMVVDPALLEAGSAAEAISLGKAAFNGLFVSQESPITRTIFPATPQNPGIDGFSEVTWTYPSALSAIQTPWFSSQVSGGTLQARVTRYERKIIDLNQAYSAFPTGERGALILSTPTTLEMVVE